jgi:muramoyltetrapeptide carboxypeptidase LdcA involved in peptidoglycan recycling
MELLENDEVKMILFATGGDFLCEMLDYLDFEKIKTLKPKWMQGFSDITGINFLFNTILDIPSVYSQTVKDYAMKPMHKSLTDALEIESGNLVKQKSFDLYEKEWFPESAENPNYLYNLTEKVEWKNIIGENKIVMEGRAIGGCLDCIQSFFATKYDNISNYLEKYKEDGFIWFLDVYEMSTPMLYRVLWQMKNAGYFKYCNGIIFGRPLFIRNDYDISFNETIKDALEKLNIPIICDADIGHVSPQMAIVNGAILKITSENGKGEIETFLK